MNIKTNIFKSIDPYQLTPVLGLQTTVDDKILFEGYFHLEVGQDLKTTAKKERKIISHIRNELQKLLTMDISKVKS
jgi:hypothetical protein